MPAVGVRAASAPSIRALACGGAAALVALLVVADVALRDAPALRAPALLPETAGPRAEAPTPAPVLAACPSPPPSELCPALPAAQAAPSCPPREPCPSLEPRASREPCPSQEPRPSSVPCPSPPLPPAPPPPPPLPSAAAPAPGALPPLALGRGVRGALPPPPPRKPRCGPATPGIWTGAVYPYEWVYNGSACSYSVASAFDFLAAFAGKRLLIVGDSVSREFAVDTMRLLLGCITYPRLRYTEPFGVRAALGGAAGAAADAACAKFNFGAGRESWADFNVSLPVGSTGAAVDLRFHWLQWPTQLADAWWWADVVLAGDFDAAVVNSYLHVVRADRKGASAEAWYAAQVAWFADALRDAGAAAAARGDGGALASHLRRRVWWRSPFPGEWAEPHYPEFKRAATVAAAAAAAATLSAAGVRVMNLDKFFVHETCAFGKPGSPPTCVTGDGTHPTAPTNVAMGWELFSVIADAIADEAGGAASPGGTDGTPPDASASAPVPAG